MSVASRIEAIEEHIGDIYDTLDYSIDTTGTNKNIVNIKTKLKDAYIDIINNGIDTLYDNFPKVTAEGTEIALNNTYEAPIKLNVVKGDTQQEGTPTPDYPQNVNVVTGEQIVSVIGKNICPFDISNDWESGQYDANGNKGASNARIRLKNLLKVEAGKTYYFDTNTGDLNYKFVVRTYDVNGTFVRSASAINNGGTLKASSSEYYFGISIYNATSESGISYSTYVTLFGNGTIKPFICLNSITNKTYEQYIKTNYTVDLGTLELCKIGDYQDTLQKSVGNQLIDFSNMIASTNASCSFTNGVFNVTATGGTYTNARYDITDLYKNNAGKTMKFTYDSIDVSSQYGSIVQLSVEYNDGTPTWYPYFLNHDLVSSTRTIPNDISNVQQVMFRVYPNNSSTSQSARVTITNPMLQFGTDTLNYEPYGKVWYKKAEIGKLILDGEYENWTIDTWFTSTDNSTHFKYAFNKYNDNYAKCISNYFIYKSGREQNNGEMNTNLPAKFLLLSINTISTVEDFKIWLGTHNVNVYYVLETPTYEVITDSTLIGQLESIKSKNDVTNITISGNLPMIINASALEKE